MYWIMLQFCKFRQNVTSHRKVPKMSKQILFLTVNIFVPCLNASLVTASRHHNNIFYTCSNVAIDTKLHQTDSNYNNLCRSLLFPRQITCNMFKFVSRYCCKWVIVKRKCHDIKCCPDCLNHLLYIFRKCETMNNEYSFLLRPCRPCKKALGMKKKAFWHKRC